MISNIGIITTKVELNDIDVWINKGYDDKPVYVEGGRDQGDYEINCIAKDMNPTVEPNYLFIMLGVKKD